MNPPILITGIGTDIGKTLVAAIVAEALQADYWKPVQAGNANGTDTHQMKDWLSNPVSVVHPELYCFKMPASPHIAAAAEQQTIRIQAIQQKAQTIQSDLGNRSLVIEGAGGLLVPLNNHETIADLALALNAKIILVSRNYLGSINHSLLTAAYCRNNKLDVLGWIFNDQYLDYESDIVRWSGYPAITSIPHIASINKTNIEVQANAIAENIRQIIVPHDQK